MQLLLKKSRQDSRHAATGHATSHHIHRSYLLHKLTVGPRIISSPFPRPNTYLYHSIMERLFNAQYACMHDWSLQHAHYIALYISISWNTPDRKFALPNCTATCIKPTSSIAVYLAVYKFRSFAVHEESYRPTYSCLLLRILTYTVEKTLSVICTEVMICRWIWYECNVMRGVYRKQIRRQRT